MQTTEIKLFTPECGDWQALYIDGVLACEGHTLSVEQVVSSISRECSINAIKFEHIVIPDEVAEQGFPTYIDDTYIEKI